MTPLLRELLARSASLALLYEEGGPNSRLVAVLLDELAVANVEDLHLPMPSDPRLRRIVDEIMALPADRGTLDAWAKRAGLSERTLVRLISRETGMSFGRWRQQLAVMLAVKWLAVKWLAGGASIQQVAADLGYESVPSFLTMFRKALGTSPGRHKAERHRTGAICRKQNTRPAGRVAMNRSRRRHPTGSSAVRWPPAIDDGSARNCQGVQRRRWASVALLDFMAFQAMPLSMARFAAIARHEGWLPGRGNAAKS